MKTLNNTNIKKVKQSINQISNNPDLLHKEELKFFVDFLKLYGCTIPTKCENSYPECIACHKITTRKCSLCEKVPYCSSGCQESNWCRHKSSCIQNDSSSYPKYSSDSCNVCSKSSTLKCGQCKLTYYCSKSCQRKDWKQHKTYCKPYSPKQREFTDVYEPESEELKMLSIFCKFTMDFEVPEFHKEYASEYPSESENISMLQRNYVLCHTNDPDCKSFSVKCFFKDDEMTLLKRWSFFDWEKLMTFIKGNPRIGDIVERTPRPFTFRSDHMNNYYTIKNSPVRNIPYFIGRTYVSIGFVDFQQLLMSNLVKDSNSDAPLRFVGYEACVIPLAKSIVLYEMIKLRCHKDSVLQVWFSSGWKERTKADFNKTCSHILKERSGLNIKVKELIKFWSETSMSIEKAKLFWSKGTENREISLLANLKSKIDRLQYSRYVFTGFLFCENENEYKHGNVVLLKLPSSYNNYVRAGENIFSTLTQDLQSGLIGPIVTSFCNLLRERLDKLASCIHSDQVVCEFHLGEITSTSTNLLKEIKALKPSMIDWSNILDYVPKKEAWKMIHSCDYQDTFHCAHFMNWIYFVYGASFIDYSGKWEDLFPKWKKEMEIQYRRQKSLFPFLRKDHFFINPYNISDKVLAQECFKYYSKYFFDKENKAEIHGEICEGLNIFERSNTTFHVVFQLQKSGAIN